MVLNAHNAVCLRIMPLNNKREGDVWEGANLLVELAKVQRAL